MNFIGKIGKGDITIEDNKVSDHSSDWSSEFTQQNHPQVVNGYVSVLCEVILSYILPKEFNTLCIFSNIFIGTRIIIR